MSKARLKAAALGATARVTNTRFAPVVPNLGRRDDMHISFGSDIPIKQLEAAFRPIPIFLTRLGVTRLSCLHINNLAWSGEERCELKDSEGHPIFIDVARRSNGRGFEAHLRSANMLPDEHMLKKLFGR